MNKLEEIIEQAVEDVLCPVVEETSAPTLMKAACRHAVREALELAARRATVDLQKAWPSWANSVRDEIRALAAELEESKR